MNEIKLKAQAKINLSLDIINKRTDNYHNVRMIMQTLGLHDIVIIEKASEGVKVSTDNPAVPDGESNIAFKAARIFKDTVDIPCGVRISIKKQIPVSAGLGGGSSDAASTLKGMDKLFNTQLNENILHDMAEKTGSDVPFFLKGGTALAEGKGEILTGLEKLPELHVLLVNPGFEVSTYFAYSQFNFNNVIERPNTQLLLNAIESREWNIVTVNMRNVLESVITPKFQVISEIKSILMKFGAKGSMMSGSGPTVFGIFNDKITAIRAYESLKNTGWKCWLTTTV